MTTFVITAEQYRRPYSWALGQLLGQKSKGSGDPANEFSITTTADHDRNGNFLGTYTLEIPVPLTGRATRGQIEAILNNPNPEQPSVVPRRIDELRDLIRNRTATNDNVLEYLEIRDGI